MAPSITLTDEQRAVVQHGEGPAVVRAVPGAGKTTAMAHRIRHLVEERGVAPDQILTSSFSRATVQDLAARVHALGVTSVDTRTLHALGLSLLRDATSGEVMPPDAPDPGAAAHILARRARTSLAADRDLDIAELGIPTQELVDQVAAWKQQLAYPDPDAAGLSPAAREKARTAQHENEDLVELYRRFERLRQRAGWLTYADMLRESWSALLHDDTLRTEAQAAYRYVLVDEFQDLSRVQYDLLDVLTAPHRNYMVIGDADQCIYGWRGADPSFLTDFDERYDATAYRLTDSFRLPAAPLVLANAVIQENKARPPKRLHLTHGFSGTAQLLAADGPAAVASRIAETAQTLQEEGYGLDEIAVLVRTYGQTPPLERAFLARNLPYRIRGSEPFYQRREVTTLLQYLYWAVLERRRDRNGWFKSAAAVERYTDRFARILKTPTRYVQHGRIDRIAQEARRRQTSVLTVLAEHQNDMHERTAERVDQFLDVAAALLDRLDAPPHETLDWLIEAIGYETALRDRSAVTERADARIRTAQELVRYAEAYDSSPALLDGIRSLAADRQDRDDEASALDLRSIHRAKGAEWPVIIVPGCTEGTLPLAHEGARDLEEERRLFYVAVTRPKENLYLATDTSAERSRFLEEAEIETRLPAVRHVREGLTVAPSSLWDEAMARLCRGLVELGLERYVQTWWSPSPDEQTALRSRLDAFRESLKHAIRRRNAHRQSQADYEADRRRAETAAHERIDALRAKLGSAPLTARHQEPDTYYPNDARFTFKWTEEESQVGVFRNDKRVGTLDPFGSHRLDAQTVLELPWPVLVGRFETVAQGRDVLRFSIDGSASASALAAEKRAALSAPDPPDETIRLLTRDAVKQGYDLLRARLSS